MRVRMITLMAGPGGVYQPGQEVDVDPQIARALAEAGYAVIVAELAEVAAVQAPERAVVPHPGPRVVTESDSGAETGKSEENLAELVGERAAQALIQAGIRSIMQARLAIQAGEDLTQIKGVGKATVKKLQEA